MLRGGVELLVRLLLLQIELGELFRREMLGGHASAGASAAGRVTITLSAVG